MNQRISHFCSVLVMLIGGLVLLGWYWDIEFLKQGLIDNISTMKANTAFCFLLAGLSLRLLQTHPLTRLRYRTALGTAFLIIIIAGLTLSEYSFNWNLGIDQLLFKDVISESTPYPGRMGINTAIDFMLMGISLYLISRKNSKSIWLSHIFSSLAAILSLVILLGHFFQATVIENLISFSTTQAIHTAISFLLLYLGLLFTKPQQGIMAVITSPLMGGLMSRWLIPWTLIFPLVIERLTLQGIYWGWYDFKAAYAIQGTLFIVFGLSIIWWVAYLLNKLEKQRISIEKLLKEINKQLKSKLTKRKQIEKDLQKSKTRFSGILEIASDAIISVDNQQTIILFNEKAQEIFGYSLEEILGQPLSLLIPKRFQNAHHNYTQEFINSSITRQIMGTRGKVWGCRQDGTEFSAEASISKLEIDQEMILTVILKDITEREQIEEALQESKKRLELALEASGDGLWDWNIKTGDVYYSSRYWKMLGYSSDELPKTVATWQQLVHPDDFVWVKKILDKHLEDTVHSYTFDYRVKTKSGQRKWIANYGKVVLWDEQANPLRMIGTHKDISQRKQEELELQEAKDKAVSANKAKSVFIANMSHELRTPLNAILGFSELLQDSITDKKSSQYIEAITSSGKSLLGLINDILDLSKIEAGKLEIQSQPFCLSKLLEEITNIFQFQAKEKDLDLLIEIDNNIPKTIIFDEFRLKQLFLNLVGNAIKFTEKGCVKIKAKCQGNDSNDEKSSITLILSVEDTGIGIAEEQQKHIFGAFNQTEGQNTRKYGGTGLGLSITKHLTQLLGGTVTLKSELGKGSIFTLTFSK